MVASATMARPGWSVPAQMFTSGAMAITGVTCSTTVSGCTARSRIGLSVTVSAKAWASRLAIRSAISALETVYQAAFSRPGASATRAAPIADGGARK